MSEEQLDNSVPNCSLSCFPSFFPSFFPSCFHDHKITYSELVSKLDEMGYKDILMGINLVMKYEYGLFELSENDKDFVELFFLLISKYPKPKKIMSFLKRFVHLYAYHDVTKRSIELYRMYFNMVPVGSVVLASEHLINLYQSFTRLEQKDIILENLRKFKITDKFIEVLTGPLYTMDNNRLDNNKLDNNSMNKNILDIFISEFPSSLELIFEVLAKEKNATVFEYLSEHLEAFPRDKIYDYISRIYEIPPRILNIVSNITKD